MIKLKAFYDGNQTQRYHSNELNIQIVLTVIEPKRGDGLGTLFM